MRESIEKFMIDVYMVEADGVQKFASPQVPTFFLVLSCDRKNEATSHIAKMIAASIEADIGIRVAVAPEQTFEECTKKRRAGRGFSLRHYSVSQLVSCSK